MIQKSGIQRVFPVLRMVLGLALMGGLLYWIGLDSFADVLKRFHLGYYLVALMLLVGHFLIQSLLLRQMMARRDLETRTGLIFRLIMISQFFGILVPGGTGPDIILCYNLARSADKKEVALMAVLFLRITVLALMSFLALAVSFHPRIESIPLRLMSAGVCFSFIAYYLFMSFHTQLKLPKWIEQALMRIRGMAFLQKLYNALASFSSDRRLMLRITPYLLASAGIKIATDYFISRSLGFDIPLHYFFIVIPLATIVTAVPITFAGLGIREGAFIGLFSILGVLPEQALAISLLSFTLSIVTAAIGSVLYGIYGTTLNMQKAGVAILFMACLIPFFAGCKERSDIESQLMADLEQLTGGHTRIVWVQDRDQLNDVFANGEYLYLMGYDSRDGQGERAILPEQGSYAKPMLSPDGMQIIYSDRPSEGVYAVNWDGQDVRRLADGFALTVWRDPSTQIDWVYYGTQPTGGGALALQRLYRLQLANPDHVEFVMEGFEVGVDSFQLSADGQIAGGNFPWPECGILHMGENRFERLGRGCWTSLAPDNSYRFWIFDGSHRNLMIFDTRNQQRVNIPVSSGPGIEGYEAYHPRWSNHPRIMTMTGPYKIRQGGNNIRGGGADVEILVGRFSPDFQSFEAWVAVTNNEWANFFPDVWVEPEFAKRDQRSAAVHDLTGARTRVTWLQDTGDGTDYLARGTQLQLMGFDSEDGRGERVILPAGRNMAKPMFTLDGQRIFFSDRHAGTMHVVDWEGDSVVDLGEGFALHTWRDPDSQIEFLYYAKDWVDDGKILPTHRYIYRRPLPPVPRNWSGFKLWVRGHTRSRRVWRQTHISEDSYQLSADGRFASAPFPWPEVGVHDIEARRWRRHGRGCWVAMSPDNSYLFWILDGPHRNLIMERINQPEQERWPVNISSLPGTGQYEVYHPRWSNHPRILAITGPYKVGEGSYRLPGGGTDVEVWLGRFTEDHRSIEHWVQVTNNDRANFYPDVWVEPNPYAVMSIPVTHTTAVARVIEDAWPSNPDALIYLWEHAAAQNEIVLPSSGDRHIFRPEARGWARFGEHQTMWADRGHFTDRLAKPLPAEFSIEGVVYDVSGAADIVQLGDELQLKVDDGEWLFRVGAKTMSLGRSPAAEEIHFVARIGPSEIALFLQGQLVGNQSLSPVSLPENITAIRWGNLQESPASAAIRLSHLAVHQGLLPDYTIQAHEQHLRAERAARVSARVERVQARVVEASSIPTPDDIAPYRRALVFNEYEIVEGDRAGERLLAAHWAILDNQVLSTAKRPPGSEHELKLVLFDDRAELEGERVAMDHEDFLLEWYYDLTL